MNLSENFNRDYLLKIEIFSKSHNHQSLYPLKLATTLKSIMNAKLSQHHTILFTCRFQNTACRLPKFHRKNSSNALLFVFVAKNQCEQILMAMWKKLYGQHMFWHCHENGHINEIQMIPHNL